MFRSKTGSLMWVAYAARPDLVYGVGAVSRKAKAPTVQAMDIVDRIAKFASDKPAHIPLGHLNLPMDKMAVIVFCDASWAPKCEDYKSLSGWFIALGSKDMSKPPQSLEDISLISWKSKLQGKAAQSSMAAELSSMDSALAQALWIRDIIAELTGMSIPIIIWTDAKDIFESVMTRRKKDPKRRSERLSMHFIRDTMDTEPNVYMKHCFDAQQMADELTKSKLASNLVVYTTHA